MKPYLNRYLVKPVFSQTSQTSIFVTTRPLNAFPTAQRPRFFITILALAIVANGILLFDLPLLWQAVAALLLTGLLPGITLVELMLGAGESAEVDQHHQEKPQYPRLEKCLYSIGAGYGIIVITLLCLSYLPGGLAQSTTLIAFNGLLVTLLILCCFKPVREPEPSAKWENDRRLSGQRWLWIGLLSLCLIGGFFRFTGLGYAEFQGDEARAMLRAAAVIQGDENALLNHKKGPTEILLPTAIYLLTGKINEATARLPFAIANFAALFATFLLGYRLFGPLAGWAGAMLLALDGYLIGFAHIVQYQSIVFLTIVLTALILYRLVYTPRQLTPYLTLAALLLATGILSHYEASLVAIPGLYLLYALWRRGVAIAQLLQSLIAPLLLGGAMLALFYIPFVRNPGFGVTYAYITHNRIGEAFSYNNLADVFERTMVYSSSYYLLLLCGLALISLITIYRRNLPRVAYWIACALLAVGIGITYQAPHLLIIGAVDYIWTLFALALGVAWFMPKFSTEERFIWLWFGAPMLLSLFFVATPNTHVYGFFIPWALLAGMVIEGGWSSLSQRVNLIALRTGGVIIAACTLLLFGNYAYWYFAHTQVEILRTWQENRPRGYWVSYEMPTSMSIFGFPMKNGWKVVGALYDAGLLKGAFATNGKDAVVDWYTRGVGNCQRDHTYYILADTVEPADDEDLAQLHQQIQETYQLFGTILVKDQPRLRIYQKSERTIDPQIFVADDYESQFDQRLSHPSFEWIGPLGQPQIQNPLDFQFGDEMRLKGFNLSHKEVYGGDEVEVTLYWEPLKVMDARYVVFTQAINRENYHKAGQRDGEPGCERHPTNSWLPGAVMVDRYRIPIAPDTPPDTYAILMGLYEREGGKRPEIFTADGQSLGDSIGIDEIRLLERASE